MVTRFFAGNILASQLKARLADATRVPVSYQWLNVSGREPLDSEIIGTAFVRQMPRLAGGHLTKKIISEVSKGKEAEVVYIPLYLSISQADNTLQRFLGRTDFAREYVSTPRGLRPSPRLVQAFGDKGTGYTYSGNCHVPASYFQRVPDAHNILSGKPLPKRKRLYRVARG